MSERPAPSTEQEALQWDGQPLEGEVIDAEMADDWSDLPREVP